MLSLVLTDSKDAEDRPGAGGSVGGTLVTQACHPSTGEVEATGKGGKGTLSYGVNLRPGWTTWDLVAKKKKKVKLIMCKMIIVLPLWVRG